MTSKKRSKRKSQKKPLGELIIILNDGKKYDFFKLPHEVRQAMLNDASTGPAIKNAIEEFKAGRK